MGRAFAHPVFDAQATFRAVMNALAQPGTVQPLAALPVPPAPLSAELAALALTLADHETPLWLCPGLRESEEVVSYLRFHTGAPLAEDAADAAFALVSRVELCPALDAFCPGLPAYPDRSTTVLLAVDVLRGGAGMTLAGSGILETARLEAGPLGPEFRAEWAANGALFPCGVDVVFAGPGCVAGLPRTTRILEG
jgi:alpha-D-ribose 1-methylphosphonate 5-triphosphate synthase subunit PhnH